MRNSKAWVGAASTVAVAVLVTGCSILPWNRVEEPVTPETPSPTASPVPPGESPVYEQSVEWKRCGSLECEQLVNIV